MIEQTRGEAVKSGVRVRTQLAEGLPLCHGDRVQLQQTNPIINAVGAMGGVRDGPRGLLISTGRAEPGGVLVAVRDPDARFLADKTGLNRNRSASRGSGHDRAAKSEVGDPSDEPVGLILG